MRIRKSIPILLTSRLVSIRLHAENPAAQPGSNEAIQKQLVEMRQSILGREEFGKMMKW